MVIVSGCMALVSCASPRATPVAADGCQLVPVASGTLPDGVYGAAAFSDGAAIFMVGGTAKDATPKTSILRLEGDLKTHQFLTGEPTTRRYLTPVVVEQDAFLLGGARPGPVPVPDVEKVDLASGTLTVVSALPEPRGFAGAALFHERIYVAGGETADKKKRTTGVDIFNPNDGTWAAGPALSVARDAKLIVIDDALYALPGHDGKQGVPVVERLSTDGARWERLPDAAVPVSSCAADG
jgi:hypothetical protein